MEKRIGTISIIIYRREIAQQVNEIISEYSDFILARQGLPLPDKGLNIINKFYLNPLKNIHYFNILFLKNQNPLKFDL